MPLDSCRAELSSSEELLEDGEVSRESSILSSPGAGGQTGRDAEVLTWCCLGCCLPESRHRGQMRVGVRSARRGARAAPPSAQRGLSSLSRL